MKNTNKIQMKKRYIEGCESNHLKSYFGSELGRYIHGARYGNNGDGS